MNKDILDVCCGGKMFYPDKKESRVLFCDKNGQWVRITEKDCAKCKSPVLAGITRAEAVEIMAKAMFCAFNPYDDWDAFKKVFSNNGFVKDAETALDALLGKEESRNGK